MNVGSWMTRNPETIGSRDTLALAQEKMTAGRFRRLPVIDPAGKLIGILSERDLRAHLGYLPSTHVDAAMTEKPITVRPDQPIEAAAAVLLERKIGGLPVVSEAGELLGIITETDLLRGLLRRVSGGEDASAQIDFQLAAPEQTVAPAIKAVEAAGGTILGFGTLRLDEPGSARAFYLRVRAANTAALADALRGGGYTVVAIHEPRGA
ncbi:MAG: CBS domain-containing protein [Deltaproteobacteria bacterium]|nr:CBS domain-containing protein [Deltaproteobacteria bacterium]